MELDNFQQYTPEVPLHGTGVLYLCSENGEDWYESLNLFTKEYKIAFEPESGVVRGITTDASGLFPLGLSVADLESLPDDCSNDGSWIYSNGEIKKKGV